MKRALGVVGGCLVVLLAGVLVSTATWSPLARLSLATASAADLAPGGLGIQLYRPAPWSRPGISAGDAQTVASHNAPGLPVGQVILAWMTANNRQPPFAGLVWVVEFTPRGSFVGSSGPACTGCHRPAIRMKYWLTFVDASTGKFLQSTEGGSQAGP